MASDETIELLDEIDDPRVGALAELRAALRPAMDAASRAVEQAERIRRKLEAAEMDEPDRAVARHFQRMHQKLGAARRDADDARDLLRKASRSLLEVQDGAGELFDEVGRDRPDHLESDPRTRSAVREPANIRRPE